MASQIELLKFNLQERQFPYFNEEELQMLLDQYGDVQIASYYGCLMKAQNNDEVKLGPLSIPSNSKYWFDMAEKFNSTTHPFGGNGYKTTLSRKDNQ
jgi:hypothetical protein